MTYKEKLIAHLKKQGADVDKFHAVGASGEWIFIKDIDEEMAKHLYEATMHIEEGHYYGFTDDRTWRGKLYTFKEICKMHLRVAKNKFLKKITWPRYATDRTFREKIWWSLWLTSVVLAYTRHMHPSLWFFSPVAISLNVICIALVFYPGAYNKWLKKE